VKEMISGTKESIKELAPMSVVYVKGNFKINRVELGASGSCL
jgi:hypothetical protein